ncbi:TipJ family phage tail tip protein [Klebsiella oxytoca]|uniref:TipJ family phage tail tip protein n=1 Tax=Klebsiella oxytoca TaxID=571 RepID=UPI003970F062
MANNIIKGRKGGSSSQRTPTEQPDDLQSVAKAKILIALGEGEFAGELTGKDIYLDGTPLLNADGSENFSGVAWEFRPGTQAQKYIQGIPGTENEISVGTEISSETAWSHTFTNTQLSAVRVRLKWPSLMKQEDDGDVVGNTVKYAIDLQTDGGAWQTVLETAVTGKTTSGYERSHRIDLPQAGSTWTLRLRKVSPDANSVKIGDVMTLQSYTEVIDAKLRYPHTALLYIEFDSSQFNGSIPQISCEPRGRVIRVPDNYNPESREYTGTWTGGFKWAWTDNPAWIYYDIVVSDRFGLGNRLTSANISKWTLYQIAQYCDQMVPDGKGGDGMEPRYLCNVYVQERNDAYTVLRDFAAIFRGMTCWSGEQIVVQADMPRDVDFNYTRANIIGKPRYSSSTSKARYTNALVSWSDPANAYADAMEPAFVPELVSRYSFNQLEVTAIGCTRQSEAHRKGLWGILTNNKDRMVEIDVGLDGKIPQPGYIIGLADELLAGRVNGGRISAVNGRVITLDRDTDAKAGDRLQLNLPSGISQARTIQSVNGRRQITVTTAYSETPETECVWVIESDDLYIQQYRVIGVKDNNNATYTITGVAHDPDKFPRIDTGAIIDQRPISVIPPGNQSPPENIVISSYSVVNQGISVETMQVHWNAVKDAISYEAQWRRNDGNWINVPRSSTTSFEVSGIYAGRYLARVRAINAAEVSSGWAYSEEKTLTGKIGLPSAPLALATTSLLHGVQLNWAFPEGSGDTQKTELQYSPNPNGNGAMALSDVAYPGKTYQQMGLQIAAMFWYRARIVDRIGNESPWTAWVQGMASDDIGEYYDKLTDAIKDTEAWQEAQRDIEETHKELTKTAEAIREEVAQQVTDINQSIDDSASEIRQQVDVQIESVNTSITENINSVNQTLSDNITAVNKSITDAVSDINASVDQQIADVNKTLTEGDAALKSQLQAVENSLKQSIAQANTGWDKAVKQETADRIADVNAKAAQAADQLLNEKNERVAAIDNLQTIIQDGDESLARQISEISAGSGQQFDSFSIWYFDKDNEGWTEDDAGQVPMQITDDGWLKALNSTASCRSPNGQTIPASSYRTVMLRIKRVGNPAWKGRLYWIGTEETGWSDARSVSIAEQEFDGDGISVVAISDVNWNASGTVRRFRLDLAQGQNADNHFLIHWISVGRPAPAASTAALRNEEMARTQADEAEALKRSTLAAQIRGTTDSNSLADLRSGLLYQEMSARITADKAEVTARESLQTQFNENKSSVAEELSSLSTAQSAQASKISGLETSLGKKADATALQSLTQKVEQQGTTLTSQGNSLTSLSNRVGKTESGVAANSNAITGLQSSVSQQDKTLTSQGSAIAKLQNDLTTTNSNVSKKADASAVTALTNRVSATEGNLTTQSGQLTMLKNTLAEGSLISNGGMDVDLSFWENSGTGSAFTYDAGEKALRTTTGSVRVANVTRIPAEAGLTLTVSFEYKTSETMNSVSSDTVGVITDLGNPVAWLSSESPWLSGVTTSWQTKTVELTIPADFTGNYVYLRFAAGGWAPSNSARLYIRKVDVFSSTGVSKKANASAVTDLTSRVDSAEGKLASHSQAITKLQNDLTTTNSNVSKKADQSALTSLTGRVEKTESGLTAANSNITSLNSSISAAKAAGDDYIPNPAFDPSYDRMGYDVVSSGAAGVPGDCPFAYVVRLAGRDHVPKINNIAVTPGDVFEMSALVACGAGQADFNLYIASGTSATEGVKARLSGGNTKTTAAWKRATWRFTVPSDTNFLRPFLQVNQSSPFGTVWYAADWHLRNVTAANRAQKTADATASAVDTLTTKVTQQGDTLSSIGSRTTALENGLKTTNSTVSQKADASAVQTLQNTVTQQGKDITAANSAITKLTSDLSTTNANVNKKADASALQTLQNTVAEQGKTLTSQGSSLTQLSNSLNEAVADADASRAIPGNLISNGSFERGQAAFTGWQSATSVITALSPYNGTRILKVVPGSNVVSLLQKISFIKDRTYKIGVFTRVSGGTTMPSGAAGNNKLRIGESGGPLKEVQFNPATLPTGSVWQEISGTWKATKTAVLDVSIMVLLATGEQYFDDFYLIDVTDETSIAASATAISNLTNRVTSAEGKLESQSSSITKLTNDLATTNATVNKKADASALQSLQNTVTEQGKTLSSQSSSITSLQNGLTTANQNIAKKADASAITSLSNRVTEAEGKLTNQSNSITQLEASFDSARDTGENLVENYDFRNQLNAWNLQNAGRIVWGASSGDGSAGVTITHTGDASNPGLMSNNAKWFPVSSSRRFRFKVRARLISGSGGILCRIFNSKTAGTYTQTQAVVTRKDGFETLTVDIPALPATTTDARIAFYVYPSATVVVVDSIAVYDVTDETAGSANASAISDLTTRVTSAEGSITSQGSAITKLRNDLSDTNANVTKKADATALNALSNRVTQTEKDISSQADSITSLNSSLNINARKGSNPWLDGTFETYDANHNLGGSARVVTGVSYSGGKCMRVSRAQNTTGNSDDLIGSRLAIRDTAVFRVEFWAMMPSGENPSSGWVTVVGLNVQNDAGANSWLGAANVSESVLAGRDKWVKFSGYAKATAKGATRAVVWISTRGANGSNTPGYNLYIDDLVITDVTDAYNAQGTADAAASAVDSLTTKVTQQGDTLSSIGNRTTALENGLKTTNSTVSQKADASAVQTLQNTVTQQGKDITAANSAITKLTSDLSTTNANVNKKADASALQTLQNTVAEQGKTLTSQGSSLTQLNNALSDTTASLAADGKIPGNLISNGSFERGQDAFTGWGSVGSVISAQSPNYGSKIAMCGVGLATLSQKVPVTKGNTYKIGVFARAQGGSVMQDQGNNKLRIGQSSLLYDRQFKTADLPTGSSWVELSGTWKATVDGMVDVAIYSSLKSGSQYFDDFYFVDVTDEVNIAANAGAISSLTTRVTTAEGKITSQGSSIVKLTNDLATTNGNVNKKADATALTALTNRVTSAEGKLESQSSSITSLQNGLTTANQNIGKKADSSTVTSLTNRVTQAENKLESQGSSVTSLNNSIAATQQDADAAKSMPGNMLANNSFERGFDGWSNSGWSTLAAQNTKSGKYIIQATKTSSGSTACDQVVKLTGGQTYRVGAWVRRSGDMAVSNASNTKISIRNSSGPLKDITIPASVGTAWTYISGDYKPTADAELTISLRSSLSAGYLYLDDAFCIDVSDEVANTVNAAAISSLTTRVTSAEGKITSQGQQLTSLQNSLGNKADASAVSSLTTRVTNAENKITATSNSLTSLNSTVGTLSSTVQAQGQTLADTNGKVNSMYSIKVETNNGKKVGAGIVLGSDGSTSDMILYADRFSLFNRNSKTAVPVMIAEGNELYIDTARIKNGSIQNAKIGDIQSNNYVGGSEGWRITKSGASEFNNVVVRGEVHANSGKFTGHIEATSGTFKGKLEAQEFIGDIAIARRYDDMEFRRNNRVRRNIYYQNRGYGMTVVLCCTLLMESPGIDRKYGYTVDVVFNVGGQQVTRKYQMMGDNGFTGTIAQEFRFAANLNADNNKVSCFVEAHGNDANFDYSCRVENITAMAFRTSSSSFS